MAEGNKGAAYKGKDGQVWQIYFKDQNDADDDAEEQELVQSEMTSLAAASSSSVDVVHEADPYSDLSIHPPRVSPSVPSVPSTSNGTGNPFRGNPFRQAAAQAVDKMAEAATVVKRLPGSEDVVLFQKMKLKEEDSEEEEDEMDALLKGSSADAVAVSMESIDIGKDNSLPSATKRFLVKTDSDLDLLLHQPSRFEEFRARGRWCWAALHKCPSWRNYLFVILIIAGVFFLYFIIIILIIELLVE